MPFEVITIMGPNFENSHSDSVRDTKQVARDIEEAYSNISERSGRIVGQHVMHLFNDFTGFENHQVRESVLFLVADIPESDVELT